VRSRRAAFWGEKVRYWEEEKKAYKEERVSSCKRRFVSARLWRAVGGIWDAMDRMSSLGRDWRLGILGDWKTSVVVRYGKDSFFFRSSVIWSMLNSMPHFCGGTPHTHLVRMK
jgi:hypothetical protein